jgi:ankyrin repeat protein
MGDDEDRPLFGATANRRHEIVELLLAAGAPVNAVRSDGESALHVAAENGDLHLMQLFLRHGADVETRNDLGWTPLLAAAAMKDLTAIKLLLDHGADLEARTREGESALTMCARTCYLEIADLLLARGARASEAEMLFIEAARGDAAAVDQRMQRHPRFAHLQNDKFTAPIHYAAERGHRQVVETLLNHGVPADIGLETYMAPIHWAAGHGQVEIIRLLVERGANVNGSDSYGGMTPLFKAGGHPLAIEALLDLGALIDAQDRAGYTPLHWAIADREIAGVRALLARGADLYVKNHDGRTALERGMESEDEGIVALMWEYR